jgi:DNA adenine methylase
MNSPLRWHGGKSYLAKRIVELMPAHTSYLDAYAGGLSVLLNKPCEGISEYANDLNGELMNFWRVLAQTPDRMLRALWGTPLSQDEFIASGATQPPDNVVRATAFFIRMRQSRQGLGRDYCTPTSRRRRGMNENVSAWLSAVDGLPEVHARLRRVEVWDPRPAVDAIAKLDGPDFLVYCDPPYVHETRSTTGEYGDFEMNLDDHKKLLLSLAGLKGKFLLSGYRCQLYDETASLCGWKCLEIDMPNNASSSSTKERKTECLWRNYE